MTLPRNPKKSFPYELGEQIGQGSMGTVYMARETSLDRPVAIKTLRQDFLEGLNEKTARDASRRFLQEARAIAKLSHPGIVSIYRLGTENGTAFIAMEWLEGEPLEKSVDAEAPFSVDKATDMIGELLDIIAVAHRSDIVHRDIKPANIIVTREGNLKLTDFGVAHVKDSDLVQTAAGSIIGTPLYAAPEQLNDGQVDARSDLYSIGVLLFEMLTGQLPFDSDNIVTLVGEILSKPPAPIRSLNPAVPASLAAVVERALDKDKTQRFGSAEAMKAALERSLLDAEASLQADGGGLDEMTATYDTPPDEQLEVPKMVVDADGRLELVAKTIVQWEPNALGNRSAELLLDRLLETPLHTEPFAGAARLGNSLFLIAEGLIYASIDVKTGRVGDEVYENLPEAAPATLYAVPNHLDTPVVMHLASILYPPKRRMERLDSTITDLPRLADRLQNDSFDGVIHLEGDEQLAYLMMHNGEPVLEVFSQGWPADPLTAPWQSWIGDHKVIAHVEERRTMLPAVTYMRELRDLELEVVDEPDAQQPEQTAGGGLAHRKLRVHTDDESTRQGRASTIWRDIYRSDRMYGLLRWLLADLPDYLRERRRFEGWKYLSEWIEPIERARLYHELERPGQKDTDAFDLVTLDADAKVLHVARRLARASVAELDALIDDVTAQKRARHKTGDIGGVFLVADHFDEEFLAAYEERLGEVKTSWMFSLQNSMTGYEGFVRIGARRGFHLMLVQLDENAYRPIFPSQS
ncbi:MAG: serine/threonine-protein kinase [Persicimonas sp.]